jgi:hypothetical protein
VNSVCGAFRSPATRYGGIVVALALAVAIVPGASRGSTSSQANARRAAFKDVVVSPSGRIGPINGRYLRMNRATQANVIKAEKRKPDWKGKVAGRSGMVATAFEYRMRISGSKKVCTRSYQFPFSTRKLSDFESNCRYLRTSNGIRVGMSAAKAEAFAGQKAEYSPDLGHQCTIEGFGIAKRSSSNWLVVWMKKYGDLSTSRYGPAEKIQLYGAHSTWWDACA